MKKPVLKIINTLLDTPYIRVYDLEYENGRHYYDASRRKKEDLVVSEPENILPDAVSGFVSVHCGDNAYLVCFPEYRYPIGNYVLSIPSGLIDEKDKDTENPIVSAMIREIEEEIGLKVKDTDDVRILAPVMYNSPGMTDECTALVAVQIQVEDLHELNHAGAEGSELFRDFTLLTKEEAREYLRRGTDTEGIPYPMVTRAALYWFVYENETVTG